MTEQHKELLGRLRAFDEGSEDFPGSYVHTVTLRNPDGPEAATLIEQQAARIEKLEAALREARRWTMAARDDRDTGTQPGNACFNAVQAIDSVLSGASSAVRAEERIIVDFQCALEGALRKAKLKRKDLANRVGVSEARVSQMFADDANVTLRSMARAFYALGHSIEIKAKRNAA